MNSTSETSNPLPLFSLGKVCATPGAINALQDANQSPQSLLSCHVLGDWGELDEEDIKENIFSLENGLRLMSSYRTTLGEKLWIITEADRSVTTILLPSEY